MSSSTNVPPSRFAPSNKTTHERLTTETVGLVALSDFRKRRAEVLEQQEREARETILAASNIGNGNATPDLSSTPNNASDNSEVERAVKKKKKTKKALLSFGDDEGGEEAGDGPVLNKKKELTGKKAEKEKVVNTSVGIVPRALTKAALRREAAERDALRKEFLLIQAAVKATEIAIPFVFYDGTNIPGGIVSVKKGDFVWVFLDKSRKVGADLGVGGDKTANVRREWARVGVDDLMLVRGTIIIPHHYEFYFFIMNKTLGPGNKRLFDYSAEAPPAPPPQSAQPAGGLSNPSKGGPKEVVDYNTLEGASDDPTFTKVVDRRWYERNKHIYPASVWQEFDPEKDYQNEIKRDLGGNAFFFAK